MKTYLQTVKCAKLECSQYQIKKEVTLIGENGIVYVPRMECAECTGVMWEVDRRETEGEVVEELPKHSNLLWCIIHNSDWPAEAIDCLNAVDGRDCRVR